MGINDVTIGDVENLAKNGWVNLPTGKKEFLLSVAQREAKTIYSGRVATLPTVEGSEEDFTIYLTAHKWEMAEGGEPQSESGEGGSVTYNNAAGESFDTLTETRYGRDAKSYLRDDSQIGIVKTR